MRHVILLLVVLVAVAQAVAQEDKNAALKRYQEVPKSA
jgi:hypothetical protein